MSTYHVPAQEPRHVAVAPTTRVGWWALWLTAAATVGLAMLGLAAAFSPDDPALSTAWGMFDLVSVAAAGLGALAAPIVALIAIIRRERAVSVYLAIVPFLLIFLHPLFMSG